MSTLAKKMDGQRVRTYWANEEKALLQQIRQFETLIPSAKRAGSAHPGEDGHFIEALVRSYVRRVVPSGLEVLSGFILRPAVKTSSSGRERAGEIDSHSGQIDLIVFDSTRYPIFQRFEDVAVVPPEGVVAIFSIKKSLKKAHLATELAALRAASGLCSCLRLDGGGRLRGPYLGLVGMTSDIKDPIADFGDAAPTVYSSGAASFESLVGYVGVLGKWSLFKSRPRNTTGRARFAYFKHGAKDGHMFLQFVATGIQSVAYDATRSSVRRPGFTAFEPDRSPTASREFDVDD